MPVPVVPVPVVPVPVVPVPVVPVPVVPVPVVVVVVVTVVVAGKQMKGLFVNKFITAKLEKNPHYCSESRSLLKRLVV